jgi:hypothetical protein
MGGNALKNCETRRVSAVDYEKIVFDVVPILRGLNFRNARINPIRSYSSKPDFGDLDVLFEIIEHVNYTDLKEEIRKAFNSKEVVSNGNCISAEYQGFQVDVIKVPSVEYFSTYIYFAFNDLGNFIGRIAHKMGFKYGHQGLVYQFRAMDDHVVEEIIISRDMPVVLRFLGYDFGMLSRGFQELEDVFIYAATSRFFNKEIFLLENRSHISRTRDKKRKNYRLFLEWMKDKSGLPEYKWPSMEECGGRKTSVEFLQEAFIQFPGFQERYEEVRLRVNKYEQYRTLFNGERIRIITGLENLELGNFIKTLKNWGDNSLEGSLQDHVLKLETQEKVDYFIKDFFELQKGFKHE